ncbi:AI-2E family transporter [Bacteroidetes bacterium endosymbiont of Geopemphigus sp.]|uniref:AI-2E family transporter n=1 Tax=Bacteroidetes bacterium endosymbiont of Geopemphigus sp. TaxID=2047937 RepID=UPI0018A87CE7|nr:AI-2E family transporter [Bacteroidetes bacterium endosymbiont of Geopemphigus sp.]
MLSVFLQNLWSSFFKDKMMVENHTKEPENKLNQKIHEGKDILAIELVKGFLGIVAIIILGYFLWEIRKIFFYLLCAMILSPIGRPIVKFFNKKLHLPISLSAMLTIGLFVFILLGILGTIVPTIAHQARDLSPLNTAELRETISSQYMLLSRWLESYGIHTLSTLSKVELFSNIDYSALPEYLNNFIMAIGGFFIDMFSVLFLTFFFMRDRIFFNNLLFSFFPATNREKYKATGAKIKSLLSRYFFGLSLQLTIMLLLYMSILLIFGIKNALIIAFFCALLNVIPYLGPLIGAFVFALLSMSSLIQEGIPFQEDIVPRVLRIMLFYFLVQIIDNFFNQPVIYSKSIQSHPVEIFLAILIGGILFGVLGMILAVPAYTVIRVALWEFFKEHEWIQQLLQRKR